MRTDHAQWWPPSVEGFDPSAHHFERLDDPGHGTSRKRFVSHEFAGEILAGKDAAQHANCRTRVATVERGVRCLQFQTASADYNRSAIPLPSRGEGAQASERAGAVSTCGEIFQLSYAFSNGAEHCVAVGNGFIAGQ